MPLEAVQICLTKHQAKRLKAISLLLLSSMTLNACADTYVEGFSSGGVDSLIVIKNTSIFKQCEPKHPYENNDSKYFVGVSCRFEGKALDTFDITYATWFDREEQRKRFYGKIEDVYDNDREVTVARYLDIDGNIVTRDVWQERAQEKINDAISQLPDSAWQTYTVDVKSRLAKYKGKTPEGRPMGIVIPLGLGMVYPSLFPSLKDRTLNLDIRIDKQGNVEVEEHYNWENELRQNPYA